MEMSAAQMRRFQTSESEMAYSKMPKHKSVKRSVGKADHTAKATAKTSGKTGRSGSTARERRLEKEKM